MSQEQEPVAFGTREQFVAFYDEHLPTVYGYLLRLTAGDRALAEDLCQEVWLGLTAELKRGNTRCADIRWLLTTSRHRYIDHVRREEVARRKLVLVAPIEESHEPDEFEPSRAMVVTATAGLEPLHRVVLFMRYVDELPVGRIAEAVGRTVPATYSLLARAREQLRDRLRDLR